MVKRIVLALLMFSMLKTPGSQLRAADSTERYWTQGQINCRWFIQATDEIQLFYVIGLREGLMVDPKSDTAMLLPNSTNGEVQAGMKAICLAPENALIRAMDAYSVLTAKIKGVADASIREMTEAARIYATYGVWPPADPPAVPKPTKQGSKL